jgi:gluconate 5-dehydrogenase
MSALFSLSGKSALITGGNSGIGYAIAEALSSAGATVTLVARREKELEKAAAVLNCEYIACDLASPTCGKELLSKAKDIDIIVNAAGVNLREPFGEVTAEAFDLHMHLHLRAPFLLTQSFAPQMKAKGWGRILNIASLQSSRAFPNSAPYGAGKGGIVQLTRAIAEEYSKFGINCNAIAPGFFHTPLTEAVFQDKERSAKLAAQTAIGRNGDLQDLWGASIFLCSNASNYITGQTLYVDGGFTAK